MKCSCVVAVAAQDAADETEKVAAVERLQWSCSWGAAARRRHSVTLQVTATEKVAAVEKLQWGCSWEAAAKKRRQ